MLPIFCSQLDPVGSTSGQVANNQGPIFFVPSTPTQKRRAKRLRPAILVPETQPSSASSSSTELSDNDYVHKETVNSTVNNDSNSDSDVNPPLIRLSQANAMRMTSDNTTQEEYDEGAELPFVRRTSGIDTVTSNNESVNSSDTESIPEPQVPIESSDTESIDIPNAQAMKYSINTEKGKETETTNDDRVLTTETKTSDTSNVEIPSTIEKVSGDENEQLQRSFATQHYGGGATAQPVTSTPKESVDGAYSLVSRTLRLSNL